MRQRRVQKLLPQPPWPSPGVAGSMRGPDAVPGSRRLAPGEKDQVVAAVHAVRRPDLADRGDLVSGPSLVRKSANTPGVRTTSPVLAAAGALAQAASPAGSEQLPPQRGNYNQ